MQHKLKRSKAPKGRYFSPEIFTDTEFLLAERQHQTGWGALRMAHLGVMANADAYGRFEWNEPFLYIHIGSRLARVKFKRLLHLLALGDSKGKPWLCRYNEEGEFDPNGCYGHVRTWSKWQSVHEREGWRIGVKCPCGEVGINESDKNELDTEKNTSGETGYSPHRTDYIEGKVYMKSPFPGGKEIRAVWHDQGWYPVEHMLEFVTDWSGLE